MLSEQCEVDTWLEAINPVDVLKFKTAWQRSVESGETFQLECRLQGNDGQQRWHLARAVSLDLADGERQWFGTFTDIQTEKDREQALKDSEAQKRAVFEGALDAVILMDHKGCILEFNPAAEKMFGKPRYEVIGELLAESVLAEGSREQCYQKLQHYLATNTGDFLNEREEVSGLRGDDGEFPMEIAFCRVPVSGQPVFTVYARDLAGSQPAVAPVDREKLDLQTRVKTLVAMIPTCVKCGNRHLPGGNWVNLEEHIILQSDTPSIEALCQGCEKSVSSKEVKNQNLRLWSKEFRSFYDCS